MSKEVKIKLFKFEELSKEVQDRLIEKERNFFFEYDSYPMNEDLKDHFEYELSKLGYPNEDVRYSLGYCQGDGMAFYGDIDRDNLPKIIRRLFPREHKINNITKQDLFNTVSFWIETTAMGMHYSHCNTMAVSFEHDSKNEKHYQLFLELRDAIQEEIKEVSRRLEREGYDIIESYNEEYFKEELKYRDDEYLEDGRKIDESDYEVA